MASPASNVSPTPETGDPTPSIAAPHTRPLVDVTAVTTRDDFLLELGECLGGKASLHPVESLEAALPQLAGTKRGQTLVLDARDIQDVPGAVERAHTEVPHAVVLVFATPETGKADRESLEDAGAFALLPIPIDRSKTGTALEEAFSEALARKAQSPAPAAAPLAVESFQASAGGPSGPEPGRKQLVWVAAGAVGLVALAAAAFLFIHSGHETARVSQATPAPSASKPGLDDASLAAPAVEMSVVKGTVDELLEKARLAMRERRYSEPAGDNALLYYRSAAAADGTNGEAADGLQRVANVLASRFEEAMGAARLDEASGALASFRTAAPKDARTSAFTVRLTAAQIGKALADGNVDRAAALLRLAQQSTPSGPADQIARWRAEIARRQEEAKVQKLASAVTDRIREGKLTDPSDDSAKAYLKQLRDLSASAALTQRVSRELNTAYLRKAREAAVANRTQDEDRWLAEAKAGGVTASELAAFQRELAGARQKALTAESDRVAQLARDRIREGRLTEAQDSAATYLSQIQSSDPGYTALSPLTHELAAKLVERARAEAQGGKPSATDDLAQAKRWGADPREILAVQQIQSGAKAAAAGARSAVAGDPVTLAAHLKRVRYKAPDYPTKALTLNLSGSVVVEFTVDVNGSPRDVRASDGTPPGVFEHAAMTAVKRWRYEPVVVDGTPVEVPVKTSIRFELPK